MEVLFDTHHLQEALSFLFDISPSKSTSVENQAGVRVSISEDAGAVFSIGTGDVIASASVPANIVSSGSFSLSLPDLYKTVTGFSPMDQSGRGVETIRMVHGSQSLTLTAKSSHNGKSISHRRTLPYFDFLSPQIELPKESTYTSIPARRLFYGLKKVLSSVSTSSEMDKYDSVMIDFGTSGITIVSTNGVVLTEYRDNVACSGSFSCVLPSLFIPRLCRVLSRMEPFSGPLENIYVSCSNRIFWIRIGGFIVGSSMSTQAFPDYKTIFNGRDKKFVVNSKVFLDNVRNILFNSPKEDQFRVSVKLSNEGMSISTASCENEGIPIENIVDYSVQLDFNAYFLEACVKNLSSEVFVLAFKDRFSPVVLSPYDGDNNTTIILATLK